MGLPRPFFFVARRLAELYDLVFADRPAWLDEVIAWQDEEAMVQATEQFLRRVERYRFPVDTEIIDLDIDACEWVLYYVPVIPLGFASGYVEEWDSFREPVQLLIKITAGACVYGDLPKYLVEEYPQFQLLEGFDTAGLSEVLRTMALDGPLAALPDMLDMVQEDTGNAWLDYAYEYLAETGGFPVWDNDYEWLAEEWDKAKPINDRVMTLMEWVEADLTERRQQVMDTLLAAYKRKSTLATSADTPAMPVRLITAEEFLSGNWTIEDE